jgi:hypothetical protein
VRPVRGIPTSRAYWELKAEQVLNRVFEPEPPIVLEVCDAPSLASGAGRGPSLEPSLADSHHPASRINQLGRQPGLLLAGAGVTVMVMAGMALVALGIWNQSQLAIRQERNMLLIERLRAMGPGTLAANDGAAKAPVPIRPVQDGALPPPPPNGGESWMDELATLPASSAPAADVLKVPVSSRITSPAPAATGAASNEGSSSAGSGGDSAPQLVGVVQVPGQSGSAIFQLSGGSTSAAVGESIGNTGWRLRSASGDSAVIEKGGEQRRVSISSGY